MMLVCNGSLVYLPLPEGMMASAPASRYEITDTPCITGIEYDQRRFVCRETAESLARKYPDVWSIEG